MANACVFCGDDSRRLTDQHVFGNRFTEFFEHHFGTSLSGVSQLFDAEGNITQYPMVPFQQRVKIVCETCNSKWMRRMEERAQPMLNAMVLGQKTRLRQPAQARLASWAALTALVLDYLHPAARVIPDAHYSSFHAEKRPLRQQFILVSHRAVPVENAGELLATALKQPVVHYHPPAGSPASEIGVLKRDMDRWSHDGRRMYKITFAIGQFVALVFGHDFPIPLTIYGVGATNAQATCIRQVSPRFDWSSAKSVDNLGGLRAFHDSFAGPPW